MQKELLNKQARPGTSTPLRVSQHGQRRYQRRNLQHYLSISVPGWSLFSAWAHDVSCGGIGLGVDRRMVKGDKLVFGLPSEQGSESKRVEAEVCNVRQDADGRWRVGLRWLGGADQIEKSVSRFVSSL